MCEVMKMYIDPNVRYTFIGEMLAAKSIDECIALCKKYERVYEKSTLNCVELSKLSPDEIIDKLFDK